MSALQIVLVVLSVLAISVIAFIFMACEIEYRVSLRRDSKVAKLITKQMIDNIDKFKIDFDWWKSVEVEKVKTKSHDGLNLVGNFIDNKSPNIALIVHGFGSKAIEMQKYCEMFYDMGYSVLAVDNRGHGESEGKTITMGHEDCNDVKSWVDFLVKKFPNCKIVVFGLSMGAATSCLYSSFKKPTNVKAIISDCAYSNAYEVFKSVCNSNVFLKMLSMLQIYDWYLKKRVGFRLKDIEVDKKIKECNLPILLIHGDKDTFVPFEMLNVLYKNCPKEFRYKIVITDAGHAESLPTKPEEYKQSVSEFLSDKI